MSSEEISPILTAAESKRALTKLERFVEKGLISRAGLQWLKIATDPWHDTPVTGVQGCPDSNTGKSVVFPVNQEIQINKPSTLAAGNWQFRVSALPTANNCQLQKCNHWGGVNGYVAASPACNFAPVMVEAMTDNVSFPDGFDPTVTTLVGQLEIPPEYTKGAFKVIGLGLEAVNTTAPLYKQGLVTCVKFNQTSAKSHQKVYFVDPPALNQIGDAQCFHVRFPPISLSEMLTHQGVTQWHAEEGFYAVVPLKDLDQSAEGASEIQPFLTDDQSCGPQNPAVSRIVYVGLFGAAQPAPLTSTVRNNARYNKQVPMDSFCAFFTGLSDQTTVTLRVRWIVERFPSNDEPDILAIASPSAYYDPLALEMYSRAMQKMPPAVMFKENPEGEWFTRVLGTLADIAGPLLMAIPHPAAKIAGTAISAGKAAYDAKNAKPKIEPVNDGKPKKKKKAKANPKRPN